MKTTRYELSKCPRCGYQMDAATCPFNDQHTPREGDVSICLECAGVNVFDANLKPRLPTAEEARATFLHPSVLRIQAAIREMWAKQN